MRPRAIINRPYDGARSVLRAIANRPYETTVVMRNRGVAVAIRWRDVAAYAGGLHVYVVGAHCMRPRAITNLPYGIGVNRKWTKTLKSSPLKMAKHSLKWRLSRKRFG